MERRLRCPGSDTAIRSQGVGVVVDLPIGEKSTVRLFCASLF
jgi:hypothetical protein